jgi:hypothetical protein
MGWTCRLASGPYRFCRSAALVGMRLGPSLWPLRCPLDMSVGCTVRLGGRVGARVVGWARGRRGLREGAAEWDGMKWKERGAEWADGRLEREWDGRLWDFGTIRARR